MASLSILAELPDISYYNEWDSVKQALQNWSVKDKFTYRTPCKDDRRARYICTQPDCRFRVTGNKDRNGRITVKVVNREHTCAREEIATESGATVPEDIVVQDASNPNSNIGDNGSAQKDTKYRNPATQMKWLVTAMERVLEVTTETKPHDIQAAAKEYYNEEISYQQAFRCLRLLTADIKEQGHRERVPDELRKAIVTLRVFLDPPMDWTEIERKTGIKARTAGYIFTSAEKKSGGSKDPFVLLRNATISASGPKAMESSAKPEKSNKNNSRSAHSAGASSEFSPAGNLASTASFEEYSEDQSQPRKRRKRDEMIDPNLDVTVELARAAADFENENDDESSANTQASIQDSSPLVAAENRMAHGIPLQPNMQPPRRTLKPPIRRFPQSAPGVEERILSELGVS